MTQKTFDVFKNQFYFQGSKKIYPTNITDVYHFDDIQSLDILDLKGYGPENIRGYMCILVVIDNISKFGWTIPSKNKNAHTIKALLKTFPYQRRKIIIF